MIPIIEYLKSGNRPPDKDTSSQPWKGMPSSMRKCIVAAKFLPLLLDYLRRNNQHQEPMSVCKMGHKYHWSITHNSRESEIHPSRRGLFYQIGKGRGSGNNRSNKHDKYYLEEHHLSFWPPTSHHVRQWQTIRSRQNWRFLSKVENHKVILNSYHPQSNDQVENINKIIKHTLKAWLEGGGKGKWRSEFPDVLWSYKMTCKNSTGEAPFLLVFGVEAMIPAEIMVPNHQTNKEMS